MYCILTLTKKNWCFKKGSFDCYVTALCILTCMFVWLQEKSRDVAKEQLRHVTWKYTNPILVLLLTHLQFCFKLGKCSDYVRDEMMKIFASRVSFPGVRDFFWCMREMVHLRLPHLPCWPPLASSVQACESLSTSGRWLWPPLQGNLL